MDLATIKFGWEVLSVIIGAILTITGFLFNQWRRTNHRIDLNDMRLERTEHDLATKPDAKDLHRLEMSITELNGRINTMSAEQQGVLRILETIQTSTAEMRKMMMEAQK